MLVTTPTAPANPPDPLSLAQYAQMVSFVWAGIAAHEISLQAHGQLLTTHQFYHILADARLDNHDFSINTLQDDVADNTNDIAVNHDIHILNLINSTNANADDIQALIASTSANADNIQSLQDQIQ